MEDLDLTEKLANQIDRIVAGMPISPSRCDTCRWLGPRDERSYFCTVEFEVPANIMVYNPPKQGDVRRTIGKFDVDRWQCKRLKDCSFHQPKFEEG